MSVNKAILVGNLGRDPELRYTSNQNPVCNFPIATNERRKDASGNWSDHTEWHTIVCFGKTAENCSNYLKKGRQVYVEGRIQTRKWQDKEGKDRYSTEVVANTVQFLSNRGGEMDSASHGGGTGPTPDEVVGGLQSADDVSKSPVDDVSFDDDDIPF